MDEHRGRRGPTGGEGVGRTEPCATQEEPTLNLSTRRGCYGSIKRCFRGHSAHTSCKCTMFAQLVFIDCDK